MYSSLRKSQLLKRLFTNASFYGAGIGLTKFGGLLLLPLYWKKLTLGDFGIIGLTQAFISLLGPILSLGLNEAMQRFYYDWSEAERPHGLSSLWIFSTGFGFIICFLLDIVGQPAFSLIFSQVEFDPYLRFSLWTAFLLNIALIPVTFLRVGERVKLFTIISLTTFLLQSLLVLCGLYVFEMGVIAYLLAQLISSAFSAMCAVFIMNRQIISPIRWGYLLAPLRYSLPLVPTAILEGVSGFIDRYFLDKFIGLKEIGIYNLGNQVGSAVNLVNQILKSAWVPFIYRACAERTDGPDILGRFSVYYISALAIPTLALSLLVKDILLLINNPPYLAIAEFAPVFALIYFIQGIGTSVGRGIDLAKKTQWSVIVPVVALISGIAALTFLVPKFGVWGAVIAMLATMIIRIATHIGMALYFYPRPLHLLSFFKLFVICAFALITGINTGSDNILTDIAINFLIIVLSSILILVYVLDGEKIISMIWLKYTRDRRTE